MRFRVFHPCGGFDDFVDSITVLAAPKTNGLTYEKPDVCRENVIKIKPNILLGTLGRVWVDSLNLTDSTRNPILTFPKAGIFWVKYAVIHPTTGCERIDSGQVTVRTPLQLLTTTKADSCGDATGSVLLNAVGGSGVYRFAKDDSTALVKTAIFNNFVAMVSQFIENQKEVCKAEIEFNLDDNINWNQQENMLKINFYRILQECFQNINKHANATQVFVTFEQSETSIVLNVEDNGVGFNYLKKKKGIGLRNMIARTEDSKGTMKVDTSPGKGTKLNFEMPQL